MIHYPKAELRLIGKDGGPMTGGPPRGVWHTTETPQTRPYDKDYYHLNLSLTDDVPKWVQLIDLGRASRGLRHPAGTVETNRRGDYCVNVSISGYARSAIEWPAAIYDEMVEVMLWCEAELGIPATFPHRFVGSEGYGTSGAARLAVQDWLDLTGWVGHQHVPYNTHWDPGRIPVAELEAKIALRRHTEEDSPVLAPSPVKRPAVELLQSRLNAWDKLWNKATEDRVTVDGVYGANTSEYVGHFQYAMGLAVTGNADATTLSLLSYYGGQQ